MMELLQCQLKCLTTVRDHCKPYVEPPKHDPPSQKPNKTLRGVTQWPQTFTKSMQNQKKTNPSSQKPNKMLRGTQKTKKKTTLF